MPYESKVGVKLLLKKEPNVFMLIAKGIHL